MTTQARGSSLPAYKCVLISEISGVGIVVYPTAGITHKTAWALTPGSIAPYNPIPTIAEAPTDFSIKGQSAASGFAAPGGSIKLIPGNGSVSNAGGNVAIQDDTGASAWNSAHLTLGIYHIWVDDTGDLRIKNSAPTSAADGTIVGTQN